MLLVVSVLRSGGILFLASRCLYFIHLNIFLKFSFSVYLFQKERERERESTRAREGQREGDTDSETGSRL